MRWFLSEIAVAFSFFAASSSALASPPPDGPPAVLVEEAEISGIAIESILFAWRVLSETFADLPPLSTVSVLYLKDDGAVVGDEGGATIRFTLPPNEHIEDGRRLIEIGTDYYIVVVRGGQARVVHPRTERHTPTE